MSGTNAQMATQVADTQADLAIDAGDYDIFSSLDDNSAEENVPGHENVQDDISAVEDADLNDDIGDELTEEDEFGDFSFEDLDDEDLDGFSENDGYEKDSTDKEDSDEEDEADDEDAESDSEEEEDEGDEAEYEEEDEDGEEVEYDGYMVNLPDGTEVNLAEAVKGYREAGQIQAMQEAFNDQKASFLEEAGSMMDYMKLAKLEADRVIEDYEDFDWAELSAEDPKKYVDNREFLDKYKQRRQEIGKAMDDLNVKEETRKEEAFAAQATVCVDTLKQDIPGWNDAVYQDLMDYAVENGAVEGEITKCVDPSIFKLLHKARQFDKGKQVMKAKVKRSVRSPKKVVKSTGKTITKPVSNKANIIKKFEAGEMGGEVFANLED
jgi:hypothetical protein